MNKKRIVLLSFSNNYDHQLSLYSLYESLVKNEQNILFYSVGIKKPKFSDIDFGENNFFVNAPRRPGLSFFAFNFRELHKLFKFLKAIKPDAIYFESLHLWNIFIILKFRKKTKIFHTIHDFIPHEGNKNGFLVNCFNKFILNTCDTIILRSLTSFKLCKNSINATNSKKIAYIPLGRKWKNFTNCNFTNKILFFGRLTKYKGLDKLFKICCLVPNYTFYIVGKPINKEDKEIVAKISTLPNAIVNSNYVSEDVMVEYFRKSDCVILPYLSSTQSGVVVDSYMLSRPCIAFKVGGVSEQIVDGITGFLVEGNDADFAKSIKFLLSMPNEQKEKMCFDSYCFGKNNYSSDVVAQYFIKLINSKVGKI